jgi:hypothetical protein
MNSLCSGTFVAVSSITCTTGGGGAAGAAFLQEVVPITVPTASNVSIVPVTGRVNACRFRSEDSSTVGFMW